MVLAPGPGTGGVVAIPLVAKGRGEADGNNLDMNYFLGIRESDGVLVADFEEGVAGSSPGLNHPVIGSTVVSSDVWHHAAVTYDRFQVAAVPRRGAGCRTCGW